VKPAPHAIKGCRRHELVAVDGWSTMLGGLYPELEFAAVSVTELDLADESLGGIVACWSLFNLARSVVPEVVDCSSVLTSETVISSALSLRRSAGSVDHPPLAAGPSRRPHQRGRLAVTAELRIPARGQAPPGALPASEAPRGGLSQTTVCDRPHSTVSTEPIFAGHPIPETHHIFKPTQHPRSYGLR